MTRRHTPAAEPLENRIAPAISIARPLPDLIATPVAPVPGIGAFSKIIDLSELTDLVAERAHHTIVDIVTNFDTDTATAGLQAGVIRIELYDDDAPLTVANWLRYAFNTNDANDYGGTFFHRAAAGFVLQGGGFRAAGDLDDHIEVGPALHNEFNPNNSNLRGTLAMAKTGIGPHTATSEWFINVANNAGNLDNQNGGFTVFGQVISGMNVVDAIMALSTRNVVGDFPAPVQDLPAGATVTADNLIQITAVNTVTQTGNSNGVTYDLVSVINPANGNPSNLVTGSIVGTDLKLNYSDTENGIARVTVRATKDGESVTDTFDITVRPNVVTEFDGDPLQAIIVPGDTATVKVKLANTGGAYATGSATIKLALSQPQNNDSGYTFGDDDAIFATFTKNLADFNSGKGLKPGEVVTIEVPVNFAAFGAAGSTVASDFRADLDATNFLNAKRMIADVTLDTAAPQQLFTDDDVPLNGNGHIFIEGAGVVEAGDFGTRALGDYTYTDGDGDNITLKVKGPGFAAVSKNGDRLNLSVRDSTERTSISTKITGSGNKQFILADVDISSTIGAINLPAATLAGHLSASGGVKSLILGGVDSELVSGDASITIGDFTTRPTQTSTIKIGLIKDLDFTSHQTVKSFTAVQWLDENFDANVASSKDTFSVEEIGTFTVTGSKATTTSGDFEADWRADGLLPVKSILIKGDTRNVTFTAAQAVNKITLADVEDSSVQIAGILKSLSAASWLNSDTTQETVAAAAINTLKIKGDLEADLRATSPTGKGLGSVSVKGATDGVTFHSAAGITALKLATVNDSGVAATGTLKNLSALSWTNTNATVEEISAGTITKATIKGNHQTSIEATTSIGTIAIGGTLDGATITSGGELKSLKLGAANDSQISVTGKLGKLTATNWLDDAGTNDTISVGSLGTLAIKGDLEADLSITTVDGAGALTIGGAYKNALLTSVGNIAAISVGSLSDADIILGSGTSVPTLRGGFTTHATLGKLTVKGTATDSQVSAYEIGQVKLTGTPTSTTVTADAIARYNRDTIALKNLDLQGDYDATGTYKVAIL